MRQGDWFRFGIPGLRVVARLSVAHGGGNPQEEQVVVIRDDEGLRFIIAYCALDEEHGYYQHAYGFSTMRGEFGISGEYVKALHYAVRRAELR